jgi:hypothetical protein
VNIALRRGLLALTRRAPKWSSTPRRKNIVAKVWIRVEAVIKAGGRKTPSKFLTTFMIPVRTRMREIAPRYA